MRTTTGSPPTALASETFAKERLDDAATFAGTCFDAHTTAATTATPLIA